MAPGHCTVTTPRRQENNYAGKAQMEMCAYSLKFIAERVPRSGFLPGNLLALLHSQARQALKKRKVS
jgi:hypothetical protein